DARIPGEELERLMIAAAAYTGDEHFGLRQGKITDFADMGILGYVMMHSRTVGDALAAYGRYNDILCSGFLMDVARGGDEVKIAIRLEHPGKGKMSRHCVEDMTSSIYNMMGRLSNRPIALIEMAFQHARPDELEPYLETFGVMPLFGREGTYMRLAADVLQYPVLYSDARLLELFDNMARQTMEQLAQEESGAMGERVTAWMRACLPAYFPTVLQTAESLGVSVRTLQHKLKLEGTSYNDLSIEVRKELARGYLAKRGVSVGDIAYALHFSEPSAFQSAFKRWTGQTPGQYRDFVLRG
ncbi:MAG: transcriptional regulator, partial [Paenibacillus sp.]|nr:transcriptional regulator [Paenibacillus sp.]